MMKVSKQLIEKIEAAFAGSWNYMGMDGRRETKPIKCGKYTYTASEEENGYIIYRSGCGTLESTFYRK